MKDRKVREICRWVDGVSQTALACESRVSPRGPARELPPEAPSQDEAHAFRDGLVIGMEIVTALLEECMETGEVPDMDEFEAYGRAVGLWLRYRADDGEDG